MGAFKGYDVLADAKSMTLYTSDNDADGKSSCTGDCAKTWPAFAASRQREPRRVSGRW